MNFTPMTLFTDKTKSKGKVITAAEEPKKDEPKKEDAPKPKEFSVSFDGDITVKNKKGDIIFKLNAADISPEDIDKLKESDLQSLAEKFIKIKELGLTIENTSVEKEGFPVGTIPPSGLPEAEKNLGKKEETKSLEDFAKEPKKDEKKKEDKKEEKKEKELSPWAQNTLKKIEAKTQAE